MRYFMNLSIKVKFLILVAMSSILPIAILGIYAYRTSVQSVTEQAGSRSETALNRLSAFIDMDLQEINDFAVNISNDGTVVDALAHVKNDASSYAGEKSNVFKEIYHPAYPINVSTNLIIVAGSGQYFTNITYDERKIGDGIRKIEAEGWYKDNNRYSDSFTFIGVKKGYIDGFGTEYHYYFYRNILDRSGDYLGVVLVDVGSYVIDRLLNSIITNSSDTIYLLDDRENIISVSSEGRSAAVNFSDLASAQKNQILVRTHLINENWSLVYLISKSNLSKSMSGIILFTFGIIALLLLFSLFVYLFINFTVTRPIIRLSRAMDKIQQRNFDIQFQAVSKDEIGALTNGFNGMVIDIREYIEKIKLEERQAKEFELEMLQAQINPHFLYNSLNSVKWMADLMGCGNISLAISHMVKLLQYSVDNINATITLKDEMEYIKGYLYLNNIRYKDKFRLTIQMSPKLEDATIPKFLIQPLVENSILHGLREKPGLGNIEILADEDQNGVLTISVMDDGVGFAYTKDFLNNLSGGSAGRVPVHIGLNNVDRRLKLLYGEEYGIAVSSEPGLGATVSIPIPARRRDG